jgi:hypothetical protein
MTLISKLAISLFISVTSIFVLHKPPAPTPAETQPAPITVWQGLEPASPLPTTTVVTTPITQPDACQTVFDMARHVGWPEHELSMVVSVAYRESRCMTRLTPKTIERRQRMVLCKSTTFGANRQSITPNGYLQAYGLIRTCDDLFDLEDNLRSALAIYRYSNGWRAWSL